MKTKLKSLSKAFTWIDPLLLLPILALLLFPAETLLLLEFIALYAWLIVFLVAIILRIKKPTYIASLLYGWTVVTLILSSIIFFWSKVHPLSGNGTMYIDSSHVSFLSTPFFPLMLSYVLHPSLLWAGLIVMLFLFVACAAVYCITIITRWRLRQYRIAYIQRDKLEMATHIKDIASNPAWWTQIRKRACKELRLIELSSQDIEDLELLVKSEQDQAFQRELERTVYELQARVREKDREGNFSMKKR